jgi:hypothetical protein
MPQLGPRRKLLPVARDRDQLAHERFVMMRRDTSCAIHHPLMTSKSLEFCGGNPKNMKTLKSKDGDPDPAIVDLQSLTSSMTEAMPISDEGWKVRSK